MFPFSNGNEKKNKQMFTLKKTQMRLMQMERMIHIRRLDAFLRRQTSLLARRACTHISSWIGL